MKGNPMNDQAIQALRIEGDLQQIYQAAKEAVVIYSLYNDHEQLVAAFKPEIEVEIA